MPAELPNDSPPKYSADVLRSAQNPRSRADAVVLDSTGSIFLLPADAKPTSKSGMNQSDLPIFHQDWWIRVARGSSYYRDLKIVDGGAILGRLTYILSSNLGLFQAQDPHWSHLGGPVVDERLSRAEQADVVCRLVKNLPRWCSGYFVCNPDRSYADLVRDAFRKAGFAHSAQMTYVRYPNDGAVMGARKGKHNGHIRRAGKRLDCVDISAAEFVRFFATNLKARGKSSYSPLEVVTRLTNEAVRRGQARVIAARSKDSPSDDSSAVLYDAAIVYVWDHSYCYYWMSTYRPPSADRAHPKPHPDAIKFLAMHAMEDAQRMNLIFDADGVTTPGSEHLYRNMFGLREEARRDIFQRTTALERIVKKIGRKSKRWLPSAA
jgi:hypothetical protein